MAVQFEFYKNPSKGTDESNTTYHPRVINLQHVSTQQLAAEIHSATTFGKSEVKAMLTELGRCLGNHLREGEKVHLDGVGYFQVTLQTTDKVHSVATRANKVTLKSIQFQADKELKSALVGMHVRRSKLGSHSASLSEADIDAKLTTHFASNLVLTRANMQSLCHFTSAMAIRHIQRLKNEGKLQNIGRRTQPIYVPCGGHYGKSQKE